MFRLAPRRTLLTRSGLRVMNPILLFVSILPHLTSVPAPGDAINVVLGDASWIARHGEPPSASASQTERIQTHLAFVEGRLRSANDPAWSASLHTLAAYRRAGVFPRRTDDSYAGRRPRFIDDRGVHCAVGHLIAASGAPALAVAIDAAHEYAYIDEIPSPALDAWARKHGFTRSELAMIQPGYRAPPDAERMRILIEDAKEAFTLQCAALHEPTRSFTLRGRGDGDGVVRVRTRSWNDFAECFAEKASMLQRGGGPYDPQPSRFRFRMRVQVRMPQEILEERISRHYLNTTTCVPRPGVDPEVAYALIRVGARGPEAAVRTVPRNREVDECLAQTVREALRDFEPGRYRLRIRRRFTLERAFQSARVVSALAVAPTYATECHAEGAPAEVRVTARATPGAGDFAVELEGGTDAFQECLRAKIQESLRSYFSVSRALPNGAFERYFRIDATAEGSTSFDVETPEAREERIEREQREFDERMQREMYY